jgi:radical SAM-linked protein
MRFLSHLELLAIFIRAARRVGLPVRHSQGFHPHPKFSFASALSVGVESWAEYADLELSVPRGAERVMADFNAALPEGIKILEARTIPWKSPSLSVIITASRYRAELPAGLCVDPAAAVERFLARDSYCYTRDAKGKNLTVDLRRELVQLAVDGSALELTIRRGKPREYLEAITGLDRDLLRDARITKTDVIFVDDDPTP